ncbi:25-hydroxyvitamin D-1 alpha hydroxylase, mitochondrial-like [Acanthaster planci]|uniref:25-hydroxyvitamin D-1 alpha hydroxylase, mitochondrial-like n=1 Tax=Acanthaster planci TaxID=133434 RepID=A0A8B7YS95_ACAPL|nr:25-hydroxyvitamin D-1 alpha hydroxylase, mitochondrial-like [Acanthaster planci]
MYRCCQVFGKFLRNDFCGPAAHWSRPKSRSVLQELTKTEAPQTVRQFEEIPGPRLWPIVGCLPDYLTNGLKNEGFHRMWEKRYEEFGKESKIVAERVFHRQWVNVYSPAIIKQVFAQEGKYPDRPSFESLKSVRQKQLGHLGIPAENGERWKKGRSLWNNRVLRPKAVEDYIPRINDVVDDFVEHIRQLVTAGPREIDGKQLKPGEVPNLLTEFMKCGLEMMGSIALSKRLGGIRPGLDLDLDAHRFVSENVQMMLHVTKLEQTTFPLYRSFPSKRYQAMKRHWLNACAIASKLMEEYADRMNDTLDSEDFTDSMAPDIYSYFLAKNTPAKELLGYMLDLLTANLDTMSNSMNMLLYCIANNPHVQEKLYSEVSEVLQGGRVTADKLKDLRYLKCCVKESSRIFMTVPGTARVLDHDIVINGYNVPKGTQINMCFQVMCKDPEIFEEPNEYRPERWLDVRKAPDMAFSHLPFGFGPRSCVGRRLVDQEMYILLANLMSKFCIENLCDSEPDLEWIGVSLSASKPVKLAFHER